jgi:hypothetical protein
VTRHKADDVNLLLPSFRERVVLLLERLAARGYSPVPRDTLRTRAEAARNDEEGRGIKDSMHLYGAAADIICDAHAWSCAQRGCGFYDELGILAEAMGLTWGGRWKRRDMPHVQGVKVGDQPAFRRLKPEQRDAFVAARLPRVTR